MPTTNSIAHELWTAGEFLEWLEPGVFADLIDGEILMHSPVSLLHANLTNFLDRLLASFIEHKGLGGIAGDRAQRRWPEVRQIRGVRSQRILGLGSYNSNPPILLSTG